MTASMYALLALTVFFANFPFLSQRALGVFALKNGKRFPHHLGEWLLGLLLAGALARLLEARAGAVHQQDWEFYAVVLCLYAVFAFPAFVWRYFWHGRNKD
ncbi:DUF2818 family protein [Conchiformibius kuhniae]|uniref:DUF2818 family protein n=1 Tax=Conchiformibius kuhniae TaxID=211502 RepID=A0A8T9MRN1_9NEIS|nr:DUF2818 family protein [Conchiformibius kuhniae]UOP04560.1 DUF2818 family protein [Conchiformibius kuhniae]